MLEVYSEVFMGKNLVCLGHENVREINNYGKIFIIVEASYEYLDVHHTILLLYGFEVFQNKRVFLFFLNNKKTL